MQTRSASKTAKEGAKRFPSVHKTACGGLFRIAVRFSLEAEPDPRQQSSNDTPVQPQPQAMGAARRDPRRGEIPVTCASAVRQLPPNAREVVSNRAISAKYGKCKYSTSCKALISEPMGIVSVQNPFTNRNMPYEQPFQSDGGRCGNGPYVCAIKTWRKGGM